MQNHHNASSEHKGDADVQLYCRIGHRNLAKIMWQFLKILKINKYIVNTNVGLQRQKTRLVLTFCVLPDEKYGKLVTMSEMVFRKRDTKIYLDNGSSSSLVWDR